VFERRKSGFVPFKKEGDDESRFCFVPVKEEEEKRRRFHSNVTLQ
jgi:hypothetical protein